MTDKGKEMKQVDEEGVAPSTASDTGTGRSWRSLFPLTLPPTFNRTCVDDYKLVVFDGSQPKGKPPFRTFSLNQTLPPFPNPNPNPNLEISIIGSLDGLVCLALAWKEDVIKLRFFNPFTGAFKQLSPFPNRYPTLSAADSITFYKDSSSGDYKLLCLLDDVRVGTFVAFVYSRRSDSWTQIEFSVISPKERPFCTWSPATFFGQCLYFDLKCFLDEPLLLWPFCAFSRIICFDVKTETFREILIPRRFPKTNPNPETNSSLASLVVLNGCLHMYLRFYTSDVERGVDVWRLKDDGDDEWVKADYAFRGQQPLQSICTESTDNWLAVLDQDDNSFKKMKTQAFKARYHNFTCPTKEYRSSRTMYVQTRVVP